MSVSKSRELKKYMCYVKFGLEVFENKSFFMNVTIYFFYKKWSHIWELVKVISLYGKFFLHVYGNTMTAYVIMYA